MGIEEDGKTVATTAQTTGAQPSRIASRRPLVLSIAGFDPSSGAGVTADLKVFAAHGAYGMACVTALTAQSTLGVKAVEPVRAETVAATLRTLAEDVEFAGIKLGMLGNEAVAREVNIFLRSVPKSTIVLDPVLRSSSGRDLLDPGGVRVVREQLLARADWITPNLDELAALTGLAVASREDVPPAAAKLRAMARELGNDRLHLVATGGHLAVPEDYLLTRSGESSWIRGDLVETNATHGTGCAFSSALLCRLVGGDAPLLAATQAKEYVTAALRAAYPVGRGKGPMNHLYALDGKNPQS
jgi:hydroxymethylpyrimidine/phosphomethylpyrimidine kinase